MDLQIVKCLLEDARISQVDLAREVSLSRPALQARMQKLRRAGVFRGFHADVDRKVLGLPITAFVTLRYGQQVVPGEVSRIRGLAADRRVLELHSVAGEDCFVLKVCAGSVEDLSRLLDHIKDTREPVTSRTTVVLGTVFEKTYPKAEAVRSARARRTGRGVGAGR
ncbi:MAG: Lrp/AsnC family transcriptional regulator [Acidobacteriota bacterium]